MGTNRDKIIEMCQVHAQIGSQSKVMESNEQGASTSTVVTSGQTNKISEIRNCDNDGGPITLFIDWGQKLIFFNDWKILLDKKTAVWDIDSQASCNVTRQGNH